MASHHEAEPRAGGAEHDASELSDDALEAVAGGRRIVEPIGLEPPAVTLPVEPIVEYLPPELSGT